MPHTHTECGRAAAAQRVAAAPYIKLLESQSEGPPKKKQPKPAESCCPRFDPATPVMSAGAHVTSGTQRKSSMETSCNEQPMRRMNIFMCSFAHSRWCASSPRNAADMRLMRPRSRATVMYVACRAL
jgi:hypothetical protein